MNVFNLTQGIMLCSSSKEFWDTLYIKKKLLKRLYSNLFAKDYNISLGYHNKPRSFHLASLCRFMKKLNDPQGLLD